jgi:DNA polymerase-3 subunit beta
MTGIPQEQINPTPTAGGAAQFHVVVDRSALLKLLSHAQSVVERKNITPILANVLLEAQQNSLKITATDTELSFEATLEAKVQSAGSITCSAHLLYDIVRKLKDGSELQLKLNPSNDTLELTCNRSDFKLSCLPAVDFPVLSAGDLPHAFRIHGAELGMILDRTYFSMAMEETRYYLNGVYLSTTESGQLCGAATDGHRLAQVQIPIPAGAENMPGVIISRKTVNQIRKLVEESAEEIEVSLSDKQINFTFGNGRLTSRLIEGKYPDYERVIPTNNDKSFEVVAPQLNEAVDRAALFANDKEQIIKLSLSPGLLEVKAFTSGTGSADEELEVKYEGSAIEFGFNARYLLDITQAFQDQTLVFEIGNESESIIIRLMDDDSTLFVLMPLRV